MVVGWSTGPKRPYKDGIGRSQTYLMLFYRLKCYLAQKDYCNSTSRKLDLGVDACGLEVTGDKERERETHLSGGTKQYPACGGL